MREQGLALVMGNTPGRIYCIIYHPNKCIHLVKFSLN